MTVIDIDLAMRHCRADDDEAPDVARYLAAAEEHAANYLGRQFFATQESLDAAVQAGTAGDRPMVATGAVTSACLLICGHLYLNREGVIAGARAGAVELPMGALDLLLPYRLGMGV